MLHQPESMHVLEHAGHADNRSRLHGTTRGSSCDTQDQHGTPASHNPECEAQAVSSCAHTTVNIAPATMHRCFNNTLQITLGIIAQSPTTTCPVVLKNILLYLHMHLTAQHHMRSSFLKRCSHPQQACAVTPLCRATEVLRSQETRYCIQMQPQHMLLWNSIQYVDQSHSTAEAAAQNYPHPLHTSHSHDTDHRIRIRHIP